MASRPRHPAEKRRPLPNRPPNEVQLPETPWLVLKRPQLAGFQAPGDRPLKFLKTREPSLAGVRWGDSSSATILSMVTGQVAERALCRVFDETCRAALEPRQLIACCFLAVAHKELAVGNNGMIPRLSLDCLEPTDLDMPLPRGFQKHNFASLAEHQEQRHVGYEE